MWVMKFGSGNLRLRSEGVRFSVQGSRFSILGVGCRIHSGFGCMVAGLECLDLGVRIQGIRFWGFGREV